MRLEMVRMKRVHEPVKVEPVALEELLAGRG
jgi:hypothetical protein